jgi:hypothetical protein
MVGAVIWFPVLSAPTSTCVLMFYWRQQFLLKCCFHLPTAQVEHNPHILNCTCSYSLISKRAWNTSCCILPHPWFFVKDVDYCQVTKVCMSGDLKTWPMPAIYQQSVGKQCGIVLSLILSNWCDVHLSCYLRSFFLRSVPYMSWYNMTEHHSYLPEEVLHSNDNQFYHASLESCYSFLPPSCVSNCCERSMLWWCMLPT